jgi:hypothetical protein
VLCASIEEATKQQLWLLKQDDKLPKVPLLLNQAQQFQISSRKILTYEDSFDSPTEESINFLHTHIMDKAIKTTASLGVMLRDLNTELSSRFVDELLIGDCHAKAIGSTNIKNRAKLGAFIGLGNTILAKYSMTGRVSILIGVLIEEAKRNIFHEDRSICDELFEN